jgi:hypothetical protein
LGAGKKFGGRAKVLFHSLYYFSMSRHLIKNNFYSVSYLDSFLTWPATCVMEIVP